MRSVFAIAVIMGLNSVALTAAPVTYSVSVVTSSVVGITGSLDFNFNPGPLTAQSASVQILNFSTSGRVAGPASLTGDAGGALPGTVTLDNGTYFNDFFEQFTYGNALAFNVSLYGSALSSPNGTALSGSTFAFSLFSDSAGTMPTLTSDLTDGYAYLVNVNLDGSTTVTDYLLNAAVPEPSTSALLTFTLVLLALRTAQIRRRFFGMALSLGLCVSAHASTLLINFETVPVEPSGPTLFATAGPVQTVIVPGVATITGGVILGDETNLPAQAYGTAPNVYATAGFGKNLSSSLNLAFNAAYPVSQVSFPVFNGAITAESYLVEAYNGGIVVASQALSGLAPNAEGGYALVNLTAPSITSVTIAPTALDATAENGWDFSIDSVALNQTIQQAIAPEPSALAFMCLGAICLAGRLKLRYRP